MIALSETTRAQVVQSINLFLASMIYRVLIVSYEVSECAPEAPSMMSLRDVTSLPSYMDIFVQ